MKLFIKYFGYVLIISSIFLLVPISAALYFKEQLSYFLLSVVISLVLGFAFLFWAKRMGGDDSALTLSEALMLTALSFIVIPLISAISFLPSFNYKFLDAFFESISGFTTTGLTLYSSLDILPKSLLIWRAETQWIGGIGIIMVFLFIASRLRFHSENHSGELSSVSKSTNFLYQAQGFPKKLESNLVITTRNIVLIYLGY